MRLNFSLFIIAVFFVSSSCYATTRYVTSTGAGLLNGTSWANAFAGTSLQAVINVSVAGDEVWVATGTYLTTSGTNRNIYFSMANGVALYGSFNGTETNSAQRNFSCGFTSVLSGEIGLAGIADNSYHVISNSSLNNSAILDGFIIRGGNANFDLTGNDDRSLGGGMLNNALNGGTCSPVIRNCFFTNNSALFGGGIFDHGQNGGNANPVITNSIFAFNNATGGGGAIDNFGYNGNASPIITNSIFYNNTATDRAGAMYCWGGGNGNASPTILNSLFINNASVDGGGIVCDRTNFVSGNSGTATPIVRNSIFWGNTAAGTGPQFYILGGAGFAATYSAVDISNQNGAQAITGPGTGNITVAPSFVNIANAIGADNCWLTNDDGLQLQLASSGIDAGNNTGVPLFDIRNYNRIANSVVDMGAYEFNATVLAANVIGLYGWSNASTNTIIWNTTAEHNHRLFEVQRSTDAVHFEKIGEVYGTGNSSSLKQYQFKDEAVVKQLNYYRLKQTDVNGHFVYSDILKLVSNATKQQAMILQNPVTNNAIILFDKEVFNESYTLCNSYGQLIEKIIITGKTAAINFAGKPSGVYFLVNSQAGVILKINKIK
jgi:hypothetical protein